MNNFDQSLSIKQSIDTDVVCSVIRILYEDTDAPTVHINFHTKFRVTLHHTSLSIAC